MKDVARAAGVSMATVSRVINNDASVRPPVRKAVEAAILELNYQPNLAARGLRKHRSGLIGLIVPWGQEPSLRIIRGVESVARERGYELLITVSDLSANTELTQVRTFAQRGVDGIVCYPVAERLGPLRRLAHEIRPPVVVMGRYAADRELPTAVGDELSGMRAALADLHAKGHRRFGLLVSEREAETVWSARSRLIEEIVGGLEDAHVVVIEFQPTMSSAAFTMDDSPTALIISSPTEVLRVLGFLRDCGVGVPDDVSLVLFSQFEQAADLRPPLATTGIDLAEYGRMAAGLLFEVMDGGERFDGRSRLLSSTYVPRGSVGRVTSERPRVPTNS